MTLQIFNETNGIFPGINEPQFTQLEYLLNTSKKANIPLPSLGLFGEASTGKTTSAKLLAEQMECPFLLLNSADVTMSNLNSKIARHFWTSLTELETTVTYNPNPFSNCFAFKTVKPCIILFDEAHELPKDVQTYLLSIMDNKGPLVDVTENKDKTIDTSNISWIFATTDSSKLLYPLTTRLFPIIFDQYTVDDIMDMIKLKYPNIEYGGLKYLANCSKLVPRVALRYAEQLTKMHPEGKVQVQQVESFIKGFLNMELNGIDGTDKRILLYLSNNKKAISPSDEVLLTGFKTTLTRLENKGCSNLSNAEHRELNKCRFNISVLEQKLSTAEYVAKSRQDISLACRILDLNNLETRLSFLEKLAFITKTPRGIALTETYL